MVVFCQGGLKQRTITQRGRGREKVKNHWPSVYTVSRVLQHVINLYNSSSQDAMMASSLPRCS